MPPPQHLLPWLMCTTNLTHKLHARSNDTVLKVIQQIWCDANVWDQDVLGLQEESVLHRDIVTLALGEPCWFARTILPATTYQAHVPLFDRLKNESLGNLIFQGDDIQRLSLRHYLITSETAEYAWIPTAVYSGQAPLWMRLSMFQVQHAASFYLTEILLPGLENYCE